MNSGLWTVNSLSARFVVVFGTGQGILEGLLKIGNGRFHLGLEFLPLVRAAVLQLFQFIRSELFLLLECSERVGPLGPRLIARSFGLRFEVGQLFAQVSHFVRQPGAFKIRLWRRRREDSRRLTTNHS